MLIVDKISFSYTTNPDRMILENVSLTLAPGEKVALMGANGSGKTTLAHCCNGLKSAICGEIRLSSHCLTRDEQVLFDFRKRIGMVFQNPDTQIVSTTVEREIAFGLENMGLSSSEIQSIVTRILKQFHLDQYRWHSPHLLSGGERQRLAIAAVIAMNPEFILMDEPTSLLDPAGREEIVQLIHHHPLFQDKGVLFITQYAEETIGMDRLIIMNSGKIVLMDTPENIFTNFLGQLTAIGIEAPIQFQLASLVEKVKTQ